MAASMGFMLAIAGKRKQATANSILMIHQLSAGAQGTFSFLQDYMKFWTKLNDKLIQLTVDNTGAKKEDINSFFAGETYLMAEEALKLKLIDEIVTI
jgi:ATP-dependent protease ClpP protease subunit